jgi:hypothetical protein
VKGFELGDRDLAGNWPEECPRTVRTAITEVIKSRLCAARRISDGWGIVTIVTVINVDEGSG